MNIDRQGAGVAPRVETGAVAFARLPALEGGTSETDTAPPSFASVLTALAPQARAQPGPGASDQPAPGTQAGAVPDVPDTLGPDPAELLAQSMVLVFPPQSDAEVPLTNQADASGLILPAAPTTMDLRIPLTGPGDAVAEPRAGDGIGIGIGIGIGVGDRDGDGLAASIPQATLPGGQPGAATVAYAPIVAADTLREAAVRPTRHRNDSAEQTASTTTLTSGNSAAMHTDGLPLPLPMEIGKADWRTAFAAQAERLVSMTAPAPAEDGGGFQSLPGLRATERQVGRSVFVPLEGVTAGAGATSTYSTGAAPGAGTVVGAEAPFAAGSSSEVAQKVHYWITRGTQTAELQLDAFGGGGVDVSIVMQGKETLVEFRSDQPEARRMLQDALPQLKDMLQSEGLRLSSSFVGTSAQQDPQGRRDGSETARAGRAGVVAVPGPSGENGRRAAAAQTHALDVFV